MSDNSIYLIGNAHLDPIWLWRWQEGCGEVLQTFRSALDRLNEYDDFVFTCSSAAYYRWVEEIDPDMFAEIQKRVKQGRWVPVNGWCVQPDCNMPSGESFARQALYSQLYYYEKFGQICRTGYNVDSFGHNGNLPQLLQQAGMHAYVMMRPGTHENSEMPENLFWWDSADGSRVITYRIPDGYGCSDERSLNRAINNCEQRVKDTGHGMMLFYGVGNHGGGPTRGDIEFLIKNMRREGFSDLEFSSPDEFFAEMLNSTIELPTWKDDLQHHASGCYSATSLVKQLNRRAENLLAAAEKWNTVAAVTAQMPAMTKDFAEAWRAVCFNQFHDIMCGCSIMEAYEDVKDSEGYAMTIAARAYNNALLRIARNIDTWIDGVSDPVCTEVRHHTGGNCGFPRPVVVFNPLSWETKVPVRVYHPSQKAVDSEGNPVPFQNVRSSRSNDSHLDTVFMAEVPALGYATYWL
ncbi:MAG: alpha-mannosidase, partial [Clostridiales bacterium]|nr:alpha-mannosidase [Clostridiales bacterium]